MGGFNRMSSVPYKPEQRPLARSMSMGPAVIPARKTPKSASRPVPRESSHEVVVTTRVVRDVASGRVVAHELVLPRDQLPLQRSGNLGNQLSQMAVEVVQRIQAMHELLNAGVLVATQAVILPIPRDLGSHGEVGVRLLLDALGTCRVALHRLVLQMEEIREPDSQDATRRLAQAFRWNGLRLCISGFGSGFDSLQELIHCPPEFLRVSPALTSAVASDSGCRSVVRALAGIARELGVHLIADQVQNSESAQRLLQLGIALQQGSFHGHAEASVRAANGP